MKKTTRILAGALLTASAFISQGAFSSTLVYVTPVTSSATCGGADRTATWNGAFQCTTGSGTGTADAADIASVFGGVWANQGSFTADGSNSMVSITLDAGSFWGGAPISGVWTLSDTYWSIYGSAVFSLHVGNGSGTPDQWLFNIAPGTKTGSFSYSVTNGTGGGLSNVFLWSSGAPTQVPEPAPLGLLGLSLAGVGFVRRRKVAAKAISRTAR